MKKTLSLLALLLLSGCGAGRQAGIPLPEPQAEAQATAPLSYPVRVHNAVSRELRLPEHARANAAPSAFGCGRTASWRAARS